MRNRRTFCLAAGTVEYHNRAVSHPPTASRRSNIASGAMEVTQLLRRVHEGDPGALHELIPLVYDELKRLASGRLRREGRPWQQQTTSLVHEAFLRMAGGRHPDYQNRAHFYAIAARLMRQILVDAARARSAAKRAADELHFEDIADPAGRSTEELLAMDEALERLEKADPLKGRLIDMRYFGGLTAEESAEALGIPAHTVRRELRLAQAWLRRELASAPTVARAGG
jgi:RNA polymerase sigma factor (TIGR02999 family)